MNNKRNVKIICIIVLIVIAVIVGGKRLEYDLFKNDEGLIERREAAIVNALNSKKAKVIYDMFSETAKSVSYSLQSNVEYLIEYVSGRIEKETLSGKTSGDSEFIKHGLRQKRIYGSYKFSAGDIEYTMIIVETASNKWQNADDGLSSLCIVKTTEMYRFSYYVDQLPLGVVSEFNIDGGSKFVSGE